MNNNELGIEPVSMLAISTGLKKVGGLFSNASLSRKQKKALKKINTIKEANASREQEILKLSLKFGLPAVSLIAILAIKNKKKRVKK
jgi:hypothetical protein